MSRYPVYAIQELVSESARFRRGEPTTPVWLLNLDQIESESGRVLEKQFVDPRALGSSTHAFDKGTVLYSKLRPYLNKVVIADDAGFATTELVPIRCNRDHVLPEYLAYFLRSPRFVSFSTAVVAGAKMPRMIMSEFWKYKIPLPPVVEQRRIAAILHKADALRAKRREALAYVDTLARSIFFTMFGDPVDNPKGWLRASIGEVIELGPQNGLYKPSTDYGSGTSILRIDAFYDGVVTDLDSLKRVRVSEKELTTFGLKENDIVINRVNSPEYLGKSALIRQLTEPVVFESNMMRFNLRGGVAEPRYVLEFLQTAFVKVQIRTASKDAVNQSSINQQDVKNFVINLPPLKLQQEFVSRVCLIDRVTSKHRQSLVALDALFTSLQHHAFQGDL